MKTAISVPDDVFQAAERLAERLKLSRSNLYSRALAEYVQERSADGVTERLNDVYAAEDSALDKVSRGLQSKSLPKERW